MNSRETFVVNIKTSAYDVLINRDTIFGNPYREWQFGRDGCIARFKTYFYKRIERDLEFKEKVLGLRGKILGCHCKPLRCHGDVYKEFLDAYEWIQKIKGEM